MSTFLTDVDPWLTAVVLGVVMLLAWLLGRWWGRRLVPEGEKPDSTSAGAIVALLGLLLGFTFSLSLAKHDQRRLMVVADSNSIGDFYTCASLLKEPTRTKLQGEIHAYLQHRLALVQSPPDEARLEKALGEAQAMHGRMEALVREAIEEGTPVVVPLVNTLNELTSNHAARLAAARDRLPPPIVLLFFVAAIVAMVLLGRHQVEAREREWAGSVGFALLVSLVVWVTLDLNQPGRGAITVSQEPLQRLLSGMSK
jgi:hypothetical protein